jgi:hypothetical protein
MKYIFATILMTLNSLSFAHDEGHGPKLTEGGKFGGVVASVIDEKDKSKGASAVRVYKAELVRSENNEVSLYIYDEKMNLLPMSKFSKVGKGVVEIEKNKKHLVTEFNFTVVKNHFEGKAPKPEKRPFNIDMQFTEGTRSLFVAFDNLD